jgi:hypothetical protein
MVSILNAHLFFSDLDNINFITIQMSFDPNQFVSPYVTLEEVLEIKKAFDLFDRDLGGAIDPRGNLITYPRAESCHQLIGY